MTSTSITTMGGVVVVTQVIPKDDATFPLNNQQDTPLAPPASLSSPAPAKVDDLTSMFLRGAPRCLGVMQIMIGVMGTLFSTTSILSANMFIYAPFALSLMFVFSGSVAAIAGRGGRAVGWIWASLLSHLLSGAVAVVGVAYLCWLLVVVRPSDIFCRQNDFMGFVMEDDNQRRCRRDLYPVNTVLYGLEGLVLVLLVVQVCVSITVSVFSGNALMLRKRYSPGQVETEDRSALLS